jgi:hypothetical protein
VNIIPQPGRFCKSLDLKARPDYHESASDEAARFATIVVRTNSVGLVPAVFSLVEEGVRVPHPVPKYVLMVERTAAPRKTVAGNQDVCIDYIVPNRRTEVKRPRSPSDSPPA